MERFKIDFSGHGSCPYGVFVRVKRFMASDAWERIDYFSTRKEAMNFYEAIKDLPEYLP
jgi:Uri superfamily endonuclease